MVFFRCTVGGSGKGNTVTVTCAEEFAGLTITLAKTGKTYTKTCPSTAPYVVTFNGVENGTYTVSCTVDGQTYSETVVVQDISCVLNYGFTWQTWVDTASQLDSSDYDTLDEVLADEKALRELFLEHACVDYMASVPVSNEDLETIINNDLCAKWINLSDYALDYLHANEVIADLMDEADKYGYGEWTLMPQVPKMTSNTAPFGEAFASSYTEAGTMPYKVFDDNNSTYWSPTRTQQGTINSYIGYDFVTPKVINRVSVKFYNATYSVSEFKIQGSNDNNTWIDLSHITGNTDVSVAFEFSNSNAYRYYRFLTLATNSNYEIDVLSLQFYAWAPKGNVPVMTGNSAPYGEAIVTSQQTGYEAYRVFDRDYATKVAMNSSVISAYVGYKFTNPINVRRVYVYTDITDRDLTYQVQYSDDNSTWVNASEVIEMERGNVANIDVADSGYHLYWRIVRTVINGGTAIMGICCELQFYGRELKVSVPTMTSNTAPFGEASASSTYDSTNYVGWHAFSPSERYGWAASSSSLTNAWCRYDFTSPMVIKAFYAKMVDNAYLNDMKVQGLVNNEWVDFLTFSVSASGEKVFAVENANNIICSSFRVFGTTNTAGGGYKFNFYGFDYSEKEFEVGTTKKWLYDHGVELETLETIKGSSTTSSVSLNDSGQIYFEPLNGTNSNYNNFNGVGKTIDVTDFNLIRCVLGDKFAMSNNFTGCVVVWNAKPVSTYSSSDRLAGIDIATPILSPKNVSLNVASVNGEHFVAVNVIYYNGRSFSVSELWLE